MTYDANSIQQLTFREGVRARVGIYLGSADHTGVLAGLLELVNNATDEALVCPTAKKIELVIGKDWASCRDYGRGIPHGRNEFSEEVMINLLTENHSGAKFNENAYGGKSRGLNGTGSAATCCSSDIFKVTSYRDNAAWHMEFLEGIPKYKICQKLPLGDNKIGTYIWYKPSQSVFNAEEINFNFQEICNIIEEYSYFNKGITFELTNAETNEIITYYSKNGLIDFANKYITNAIHSTPIHYTTTEEDVDIEIIAQWTRGKEKYYIFSNGGENPAGGTPLTGMKTAITSFVKKNISEDFDGDMARNGLIYICSVNLKNPIYDGQTKSRITNPNLRGIAQRAMGQALNNFKNNSKEFEEVLKYLRATRKASKAAEREYNAVLNASAAIEKNQKKKVFASDKLKDAEHLGQNSILLVVEGLSAASSMAVARDIKQYGILALRGKLINCLANTEEDIFKNEEINLLLSAMNIIPNKYDASKLRYGKIAICVDADSDGFHIGLLVMAAIYKFAPQFIQEGRLCWLRSPLYIEKIGKQEKYYFTDEEISNVSIKGELQRNKGLGSLSAEQAKNSMFNAANQRLEVLIPTNDSLLLLSQLMGEDNSYRKQFIFEKVDFSTIHE